MSDEARIDNTRTPKYEQLQIERIDPTNAWDGTEISSPSGKMKVPNTLDDYVSLKYGKVGTPLGGSPMDYMDAPANAIIPFMSRASQSKYITKIVADLGNARYKALGKKVLKPVEVLDGSKYITKPENVAWMDELEKNIRNLPEEYQDAWLISTLDNMNNVEITFDKAKKGSSFYPRTKDGENHSIVFSADASPNSVMHEIAHLTDFTLLDKPNTWSSMSNNLSDELEGIVTKYATDDKGNVVSAYKKLQNTLDANGVPNNAVGAIGDIRAMSAKHPITKDKGYGHSIDYRNDIAEQYGRDDAALNIEGFADVYETIPTWQGVLNNNKRLDNKMTGIVKNDKRRDRAKEFVPKEYFVEETTPSYNEDVLYDLYKKYDEAGLNGDWDLQQEIAKQIDNLMR